MPNLEGPRGPIAYERDALGYPSIQARDFLDGVYALGYFHAIDRLVQVTINLLAARGELMSFLGDVPFARLIDRSMRALGGGDETEEAIRRLDPETRKVLAVYCAGFNRGARERGRPIVLRALGVPVTDYTPERMAALFRFVTYFGLTSMQLSAEFIVAELAARGAPRRVFERILGEGAQGMSLEDARLLQIPENQRYFISPPGVSFGSSPLVGSNAFAVAKERSSTGGALLMGEFHMEVGRLPPLLYAAHIALADGNYLAGVTIPGMAWLAAGRTRDVGWSYTFAHADNVDLIVERVDAERYEVLGEQRPFRKRIERVRVRGKPDETWTFYENEYGTLIGDARGKGHRACVRVSGKDQIHRALAATRRLLDCRTVEELVDLHREVRSISLEVVAADSNGAIGSIVTGQIDRRPEGWTGVVPRRGWDLADRDPAPLPEELRPVLVRPESGVLASANQGGQGPHRKLWCPLPEPLYRFERLTELLAARERHDLDSLLAISYDRYDRCAARLLRVWRPLLPAHPMAERLCNWAEEQRDARFAGLFHKLHEEMYFALLEEDIGAVARCMTEWSALTFYQHHVDDVLALERPDLLDREGLRALLIRAFPRALAEYERYSVPVRLRFRHLVTQGRSPAWLGFDSPLYELPGTPTSLFQSRVAYAGGEKLVYGPAFHILFDMREPGAFYNLPGGASESRFGAGYGAGIREWLRGDLFPLGPVQRPVPARPPERR